MLRCCHSKSPRQSLLFVLLVLLLLLPTTSSLWIGDGTVTTEIKRCSTRLSDSIASKGDSVKTSDLFSLDSIRSTLIRQEETIIFSLIERAQYRRNFDIYNPKKLNLENVYGSPLSFLEWMLIETEKLHSKVRRYTSPEEHPFFGPLLPPPVIDELDFPDLLGVDKDEVNVNPEVLRWYVEKIIRQLCNSGDDEQHGSTVLCDINALQALSRRVHLGKFVAESKYLQSPEEYNRMVQAGDVMGILKMLTNKEVERGVIRRAFLKASQYGKDITSPPAPSAAAAAVTAPDPPKNSSFAAMFRSVDMKMEGYKVDPMLIADIYRDMIIPLTKDVEVRYLFRRCGKSCFVV